MTFTVSGIFSSVRLEMYSKVYPKSRVFNFSGNASEFHLFTLKQATVIPAQTLIFYNTLLFTGYRVNASIDGRLGDTGKVPIVLISLYGSF